MKTFDLTGQHFGKWTVLYRVENDKYGAARWHCKCECGKEADVLGKTLRNGTSVSCGCYQKKVVAELGKKSAKDITGQKFGRLLVLKRYGTSNDKKATWLCKCDCGNEVVVTGKSLRRGTTLSCGCYNKEQINKRNHLLTTYKPGDIINDTKIINIYYQNGEAKAKAICKYCGRIFDVSLDHLKSNHTQSCGCKSGHSIGEEKIIKILNDNNITFIKEKTFDDFYYEDTNTKPRFDFYIIAKTPYIIEYDGVQHFESNGGWNTEEHLKNIQKRDIIKNEYCFKNNIPIIRIPYTALNNLSINDLLLDKTRYLLQHGEEVTE